MPVVRPETRAEIARGDICAQFLPGLGGALARLTWRGIDLLRAAPRDCTDVRETACFPLAPFANRIADARFAFAGERVALPDNGIAAPHAAHGFAWQGDWSVTAHRGDRLELRLDHDGPAWPWRTRVSQVATLTDRGLLLALSIENADARPMPAGLGFHPYFRRSVDTRLIANVTGGWSPDERRIATRWSADPAASLRRGDPVAALAPADLCCAGWDGQLRVADDAATVAIRASAELPYLHLFVPEDADFFCAEPVSHVPDALNRRDATPMAVIEPGASLSATILIEAEARSPRI